MHQFFVFESQKVVRGLFPTVQADDVSMHLDSNVTSSWHGEQ